MRPDPPRVIARGHATVREPASASRNTVSMYADPAAWLVESAVGEALAALPEAVPADEVGMLAVSAYGTRHTMRSIATGAARGRVSPLRFSGAAPGSLAGLTCIVRGFRGPSLLLCMDPEDARPAVEVIAGGWLATGQCRHVVIAEHTVTELGHTVDARIVRRNGN